MAEEKKPNVHAIEEEEEEEEDSEEVEEGWDDWNADDEEDTESDLLLCLFCDSKFNTSESLFQHCEAAHDFFFHRFRSMFSLKFYDTVKVINYIRSQVAVNKCWSCGLQCSSNEDLQSHLHDSVTIRDVMKEDGNLVWMDDKYLKPFLQDDSLLYSFAEDDDIQDDTSASFYKEEVMSELQINEGLERINLDDDNLVEKLELGSGVGNEPKEANEASSSSDKSSNLSKSLENVRANGTSDGMEGEPPRQKQKGKHLKIAFTDASAREKKNVNDGYFGAYSSFGIHREMISDKVRMDAYRGAILNNPSLINCGTVMDVGCGTGILSLFAAQAGASKVIAVEASEKMALVAAQIAKENGWLWDDSANSGKGTGVIRVVRGMVEELDKSINIPAHSIDVLLSEWMGYCLLYETMLDSVLYARDKWLKPGGAMLPDTATIYVAGFGKGGTSIPFWEDVYGFNMSCIGKEVVEDSSQFPIVDVVDGRDIMTNAVVIQNFDLMTVKPDELDFTTSFGLKLKSEHICKTQSKPTWCYGVVLWFETGFTSRFCKELPTVLSTSPYTPKTHWSQTILTFREPIAMGPEKPNSDVKSVIGSDSSPVTRIQSRISIVRAAQHRSIDISLETSAVALDGRKRSWPVQIFNL